MIDFKTLNSKVQQMISEDAERLSMSIDDYLLDSEDWWGVISTDGKVIVSSNTNAFLYDFTKPSEGFYGSSLKSIPLHEAIELLNKQILD